MDIVDSKAKLVCIQLPDGLKPDAAQIEQEISAKTDAKVLFWLGSCFGACDIPQGLRALGIDMVISYGHNRFRKEMW